MGCNLPEIKPDLEEGYDAFLTFIYNKNKRQISKALGGHTGKSHGEDTSGIAKNLVDCTNRYAKCHDMFYDITVIIKSTSHVFKFLSAPTNLSLFVEKTWDLREC